MARIRTIKPDFWTDGNIVRLSPYARLLFIGMWNFTMCDHGHVADDSMKLKLQILPLDDVDIEALLAELMASGRIQRVTGNTGRTYLHVTRFEDHQKIDPRWKTRCAACAEIAPDISSGTHRSFHELSGTHSNSAQLPLGRDGMGVNTPSSLTRDTTDFDAFWAEYPRKVGKTAARKAFTRALAVAPQERIMQALNDLKEAVEGKDSQFTPYPAKWLNDGRWDDEPALAQTTAGTPWSKEFHG